MKNNPIPAVGRITKNVARQFWQELKVRNFAAMITVLVAAVIAYGFFSPVWWQGAAGILLAFAFGMTFYIRNLKAEIKELKDEPTTPEQ